MSIPSAEVVKHVLQTPKAWFLFAYRGSNFIPRWTLSDWGAFDKELGCVAAGVGDVICYDTDASARDRRERQ
jgi:hypothetical protein